MKDISLLFNREVCVLNIFFSSRSRETRVLQNLLIFNGSILIPDFSVVHIKDVR